MRTDEDVIKFRLVSDSHLTTNGAKAKFWMQYILRKYPIKKYETLPVPIT